MSQSEKNTAGARHLRHRGPAHSSPYPVSRLSGPIDIIATAREIAAAEHIVGVRTSAKLQVIAEQIRALQEQARRVLEEARDDQRLHHARCGFKRMPGKTYHLYRKTGGELEFSLLSPADWRDRPPHEFVGSYRLEPDMSWTAV
jgi:hypothetical protein